MKSNRFFIVILVVCFVSLSAGILSAQMREGAISLNPQIGGYVFEGNQDAEDDWTYGLGLGYSFDEHWGIEGNFNYVDTESTSPEAEDVKAYIYRLDGLYHFMPDKKLVPYVAAGIGGITINGGADDGSDPLFNYGAGIKYFLTKNFAIRGDVRHLISEGGSDGPNNNLAYTFGLNYLFGGKEKEEAPPPPPQPVDSDGDGVYDDMDKCPNTPKGVAVDKNGCPLDSDGDGVPDYLDKCPDTPKGAAVDKNGCPLDSDGDGVPDYLDKCPNTPKGVAVDKNGCPLDSDGDGVPDYLDKCPDTPKGVKVDANGCPPPAEKTISLEDIHFEYDEATLTSEAKMILDKNIETIKDNPEIRIRIEGHSCAHGPDDYNLRLSERRANAVKEYLVTGGAAADRLSTITYGETRLAMPETPTPENRNSEEAKANRRVHFEVIFQ